MPSRLRSLAYSGSMLAADVSAWLLAYFWVVDASVITVFKFQILGAAWLLWSALIAKTYSQRKPFFAEWVQSLQALLLLFITGFLLKLIIGNPDSLPDWFQACVLLLLAIPGFRWLAKKSLSLTTFGWRPALIFGCGINAQQASNAITSEPSLGLKVTGFIDPPGQESEKVLSGAPWPQSKADFLAMTNYECIIALEPEQSELRDQLIRNLIQFGLKKIHVIPSMRGVPLFGLQSTQFLSHELMMIHVNNNSLNFSYTVIKRCFDLIVSIVLLILFLPIMIWVGLMVWRSDGGPIFFNQKRIGKDLKPFTFYKFRSMIQNSEEIIQQWEKDNTPEWQCYVANNFKLDPDPRLIKFGAFIRNYSLDELPQLFNVIKGDMSLVGPRPLLPREQVYYGQDIDFYAQALPGITGLWQISGRSNTKFEDRIQYDSWYIKNASLSMDLVILLKTLDVVLYRKGAV
jgi:Undecaprenyl-phosphate galactose phosphotransferase WbaP